MRISYWSSDLCSSDLVKFHPYWNKMLLLAALKGLTQGFLVTAPAMLIMRLLGQEGALGTAQSIGAIVAAVMMYVIGTFPGPRHRLAIFAVGLICFALAAVLNALGRASCRARVCQ